MGLSVEFCTGLLFLLPFCPSKDMKITPLENLVSTGVVFGSFFMQDSYREVEENE